MIFVNLVTDNLNIQILVIILKSTGYFHLFQPQVQIVYNILFFLSHMTPFVLAIYTTIVIIFLVIDLSNDKETIIEESEDEPSNS